MSSYLRAATFNLKNPALIFGANAWKFRRELLWETFRRLDADVIGVQELTPRMRIDFLSELGEYNLVGRGRGGLFFDEHSDIAVKSGLRVKFESTFRLSMSRNGRNFSLKSPLSWIFPRICTTAEVKLGERKIRVFNTHLDMVSDTIRAVQLSLICRRISELSAREPMPTLLMGDFNCKPGARSLKLLEDGYGYENVHLRPLASELEGGTFHLFRGGLGRQRLDHIYASPEFSLVESEIFRYGSDKRWPSDHYPLITTLKLD